MSTFMLIWWLLHMKDGDIKKEPRFGGSGASASYEYPNYEKTAICLTKGGILGSCLDTPVNGSCSCRELGE